MIGGKQTVSDIMGMTVCFIVDKEKETLLAQSIPLVIQSVLVLTMLHRSYSSRKFVFKLLFHVRWSFFQKFHKNVFVARKNGQVVGTVEKDVKGRLYPTIAVHSQNEE